MPPKKLTYTRRELRQYVRRAEREKPGSRCREEAWELVREATATYMKETGKVGPKGT